MSADKAPSKDAPPAAAEAPKAPVVTTVELVDLRAVFGPINHPYTHTWFDTEKVTSHVIDDWVRTQIDAGKIAHA